MSHRIKEEAGDQQVKVMEVEEITVTIQLEEDMVKVVDMDNKEVPIMVVDIRVVDIIKLDIKVVEEGMEVEVAEAITIFQDIK